MKNGRKQTFSLIREGACLRHPDGPHNKHRMRTRNIKLAIKEDGAVQQNPVYSNFNYSYSY